MRLMFVIRPLGSLPWPNGLGKYEYRNLEIRMRELLGDFYGDPATHKRAFETDDRYRAIALEELSETSWSSDLLDAVDCAVDLAGRAPLLGQPLEAPTPWRHWAETYRDVGFPVYSALASPPRVIDINHTLGDGRHRLTYLRLHRGPDYRVLVKVNY